MYDSGLTLERDKEEGEEEKPVHSGTDWTIATGSGELIPLLTGNCWSVIPSWFRFAHAPNSDPKGHFAIVQVSLVHMLVPGPSLDWRGLQGRCSNHQPGCTRTLRHS